MAVLSHRFWETQLGSDPAVIDQVIVVNGQSLTIIGVAPDGFRGTTLGSDPRVFVPLTMRGALGSNAGDFDRRNAYWAYVFGRLKDGGSLAQASEGINAIYGPIITDVEAPQQENISAATLQRFKARKVTLTPGARGQGRTCTPRPDSRSSSSSPSPASSSSSPAPTSPTSCSRVPPTGPWRWRSASRSAPRAGN